MKRGRVPSLSVSRQFYGAIRPKLQPSVYYRKLAGNIPDVKTMRMLLRDLGVLGYQKVKLVTDISANTSLSFVKRAIESVKDTICDWSHYDDKYDLYTHTQTIEWEYAQDRPYKGDTLKESRRMYLLLYYNAEKAGKDGHKFNLRMIALQQELTSGKRRAEHEKDYGKYFEVKHPPVRGVRVIPRQEAMDETKSRFGFFVLLSNEVKDSQIALEIYRNKDVDVLAPDAIASL